MPKPPRPSASEVLRHNLLILVGLPSHNQPFERECSALQYTINTTSRVEYPFSSSVHVCPTLQYTLQSLNKNFVLKGIFSCILLLARISHSSLVLQILTRHSESV